MRLNNAKSLKPQDHGCILSFRFVQSSKMQITAHSAVFYYAKCSTDIGQRDLYGDFRRCEKLLSTEVGRTRAAWPLLASTCQHLIFLSCIIFNMLLLPHHDSPSNKTSSLCVHIFLWFHLMEATTVEFLTTRYVAKCDWWCLVCVQSLEVLLRHPEDNRNQIRELAQTLMDGGVLDELIQQKLDAFNTRWDELMARVRHTVTFKSLGLIYF